MVGRMGGFTDLGLDKEGGGVFGRFEIGGSVVRDKECLKGGVSGRLGGRCSVRHLIDRGNE